MKKILISMIAAAAVFTSCEKEADIVATGDLVVKALVEENTTSQLGKTEVERGTIPVYVTGINVQTFSPAGDKNKEFNLVENGTSGAQKAFVINNVPTGPNTIVAQTMPINGAGVNDIFVVNGYQSDVTRKTVVNDWLAGVNTDLFAIYKGQEDVLITTNDVANVVVPMTTQYGRIMTAFVVESPNNLAQYNVTVTTGNKSDILGAGNDGQTSNGGLVHVWNDFTSQGNQTVTYTLVWRAKGTTEVLKTATLNVDLSAGVDKFTKVVIKDTSFEVETLGLTFDFTEIEEVDEIVEIGGVDNSAPSTPSTAEEFAAELCNEVAGTSVDATVAYWGSVTDGGFARGTMTFDGVSSSVFQLKNGTSNDVEFTVTTNQNTYTISANANTWLLVKGVAGEVITNVVATASGEQVWTKGGTSTLGGDFCNN